MQVPFTIRTESVVRSDYPVLGITIGREFVLNAWNLSTDSTKHRL